MRNASHPGRGRRARSIRGIALAATALTLLAGFDGCGRPAGPHKPRVALVMKSLANEFFATMEAGARDHQRAHAGEYDLVANGIKDELDVAAQVALVEQMTAQHVDAIVIAPADSKALVAACAKALEAGVVVVNIDNRLEASVLAGRNLSIPFVGPDNRKGAKLAGDYLAARLEPDAEVALLDGVPGAFNAVQRRLGFEDAAAARGLKIVTAQSADWESAKASDVASAILREHPRLRALLCANDSMALGAVAAVRAAGRSNTVLVGGFDNISAARDLVRSGQIVATVDQHGDSLAVFGIEFALDLLRTKRAPADHETPVDLITAETLGKP
jgi:ribose transport system substrate-binding protein